MKNGEHPSSEEPTIRDVFDAVAAGRQEMQEFRQEVLEFRQMAADRFDDIDEVIIRDSKRITELEQRVEALEQRTA